MKTEHTPGPWKVAKDGTTVFANGDSWKYTPIADCSAGIKAGKEIDLANARLIAAAPAMLEALEAVQLGHIGGQRHGGDNCLVCVAIAQAKGL